MALDLPFWLPRLACRLFHSVPVVACGALRLEEGETVQDAVKRYEKPDPMFFSRLNLPPRIPKPEFSQQVGKSVLRDGQWQDLSAAAATPRARTR